MTTRRRTGAATNKASRARGRRQRKQRQRERGRWNGRVPEVQLHVAHNGQSHREFYSVFIDGAKLAVVPFIHGVLVAEVEPHSVVAAAAHAFFSIAENNGCHYVVLARRVTSPVCISASAASDGNDARVRASEAEAADEDEPRARAADENRERLDANDRP